MKQTMKHRNHTIEKTARYAHNEDHFARTILDEEQLLRLSRFAARDLSKSWKYFLPHKKADMLIKKIVEVLNNENYKAKRVLEHGEYGIRFEGRTPQIDSVQRLLSLTLLRTRVYGLDPDVTVSKLRIARHIENLPEFLSRSLVFNLDGVENGVMASRSIITKILQPLPRIQRK